MVKEPVNVRSFKKTTFRVKPVDATEVSTANGTVFIKSWAESKIVKAASKAVYLRRSEPIDLGSINHALRGRVEPIAPVTSHMDERETA